MSVAMRASRGQVWLDSLDWSWPGQGGAAVEVLPPPWIPAFPPRRAPAVARPAGPPAWRAPRTRGQRLLIGVLLSVLASFCLLLARGEQTSLASLVGLPGAGTVEQEAPAISSAPAVSTLPTLEPVSQDAAGSAIVEANYSSPACRRATGAPPPTTPFSTCSPAMTSPTAPSCRSASRASSIG